MEASQRHVDATRSGGQRRFLLVNRTMSRNYEYINDEDASGNSDKPASFIADMTSFSAGRPDMILHAGPDVKTSPSAVACANRPGFSRTLRIGLGDIIRAGKRVQWQDMKTESFFSNHHIWVFDRHYQPGGERRRVTLRWGPTSHHAVDGKKPSRLGHTNWKLVEVDGPRDRILGVFTGQRGVSRTCGTLQINVDWGKDFDHMVLMTVVALYDRVKRQRRAAISAST